VDELDKVEQLQAANYRTARGVLGETTGLVEDLVQLYQLLLDLIEESKLPPRDEVVACAQFLAACRCQLTLSALSALRGQLSDSFFFSRKAIELCAFAARVKNHPHLGLEWLQAWHDPEAYERFRKKFSVGKLFPEDHELLGRLYDRYDFSSKFVHPSFFSLGRHIEVVRGQTHFRLNFNYSALKDEDLSEPAGTFLWIADTHFGIIRVFEDIFKAAVAYNDARWQVHRNAVDAKITIHKLRWRPILLSAEGRQNS